MIRPFYIIAVCYFLLTLVPLKAQQDPMFTKYRVAPPLLFSLGAESLSLRSEPED
jgi:hypothetical protein